MSKSKKSSSEIKTITLRTKITILIIIISVYPMILMGIIAAYNFNNIIKENFVVHSQNNLLRISSGLNQDVQAMKDSILYTLQNPAFRRLVNKESSTPLNSISRYELTEDVLDRFSFIVFTEENYDVGGLYFRENDDNIVYQQQAGMINDDDIPYMEMWDYMGSDRAPKFYRDYNAQRLDIYLLQAVIDNNSFEKVGMIYYRLDPDYLSSIFNDGYEEEDASLFLYTKSGDMIAREGSHSVDYFIEPNQYYLKEPGVYIHDYEGENYYVITEYINSLDLTVMTMISSDDLTEASRKVSDLVIILYLVNIPIILGLSYFLYSNINNPVTRLISKMEQFKDGRFDVQINDPRHDEFGYLYIAFNDMTSNINRLVKDVYVKELARKDAEISALQEQINPHFLYNTLESINWRAQLAGENDIAHMIQALSKLMDGSMNRDNENLITVEKEAEYMKQYMYLVQMRYSETLNYVCEIDEEVKHSYLPKLIIQPLLENAVKHGIEPVGEGVIRLSCKKEGDRLVIEVSDNGKGMTDEALKRIRDSIDKEIRDVNRHKEHRVSIGFRNVARRIELIYNGEASVTVDSEPDKGTCIKLDLPFGLKLDKFDNLVVEGDAYESL